MPDLRLIGESGRRATSLSGVFGHTLLHQHVKHRFTRPYTPRTKGKAERFIHTALREWAYARSYQTSLGCHEQLDPWLHDYNFHRPMPASISTRPLLAPACIGTTS
jgi:hypothetical protein